MNNAMLVALILVPFSSMAVLFWYLIKDCEDPKLKFLCAITFSTLAASSVLLGINFILQAVALITEG